PRLARQRLWGRRAADGPATTACPPSLVGRRPARRPGTVSPSGVGSALVAGGEIAGLALVRRQETSRSVLLAVVGVRVDAPQLLALPALQPALGDLHLVA